MRDLSFRAATGADVGVLQPFVHAAYRGDSARRGWTHEADLLDGERIDAETLEQVIADPAQVVILAQRGGLLAGCVQVTDKGGGLAYLGMLSVDPAGQGRGVGRALIGAAEDAARTRFGAHRMEMTVIVQRAELIDWYVRCGYRRTGEMRPFPAADPRFGRPRRDDLAFVVLERELALRLMTPRLVLRSARADDLEGFHRILSDPRATRWWSTPPHESLDQTHDWLAAMIGMGTDNPDFVIERDGVLIGKAGFFALPDIGYILHPDHWGQGLASEAVEAAIDHVWATRDLETLTAEVDPDNAASIRILERMGFRRTGFRPAGVPIGGVWMDCVDYALTRADWRGRTRT